MKLINNNVHKMVHNRPKSCFLRGSISLWKNLGMVLFVAARFEGPSTLGVFDTLVCIPNLFLSMGYKYIPHFEIYVQTFVVVKTPTLPQHNGWVWHENDFANPTHPPTTQTQHQQYLSWYWPDFDETLKVGSCEHLEQIPTVMGIFVQVTFVQAKSVHIRNI